MVLIIVRGIETSQRREHNMAVNCCKLVVDLDCSPYCLTSISNNSSTEISSACGPGADPIIGATIGTLSITGYVVQTPHYGCTGEAGVSINWIRKYDCIEDVTYFIFAGEGNSYYYGDVQGTVSLHREILQYEVFSANVGNSPATLYTNDTRHDGYGMTITGAPINFSTSEDSGVILEAGICGIGEDSLMYLTNFSVKFPMGELPTATYSFVYSLPKS